MAPPQTQQPRAPPGAPANRSPKKSAAEDNLFLRRMPMKDGSVRAWYEARPDDQLDVSQLAAVAEWWDVQEVRGYQVRPRQLGVLRDRGVVVVNGNKFKWYRPSCLFDAVYHDPSRDNVLTLEYKAGAGQGFVSKESLTSQLIFSSADQCRRLRTKLAEILIQQLAGQDFLQAEMRAGEVQLQDIQQMIRTKKVDKESTMVDRRPNVINAAPNFQQVVQPVLQPTPPQTPKDENKKRARPPSACSVDSDDVAADIDMQAALQHINLQTMTEQLSLYP